MNFIMCNDYCEDLEIRNIQFIFFLLSYLTTFLSYTVYMVRKMIMNDEFVCEMKRQWSGLDLFELLNGRTEENHDRLSSGTNTNQEYRCSGLDTVS
jgi:hypothetical protein